MKSTRAVFYKFDRTGRFCDAEFMLLPIRKFIAVLIAIWLPLFSGNVLAVSIAMQAMDSDCHPAAVQQNEHQLHHAQAAQHHQLAADQVQSADLPVDFQDQQHSGCENQDSGCGNSGICHLACSGYMAAVSITVAIDQPLAQLFVSSSTSFKSVALTPLDPPPLTRA